MADRRADDRQRLLDDRQRFLDRCFESLKHVTTLSTASALVILAIYRETPFERRLLAITLILIGLCVVISVYGMLMIARNSGTPPPNQSALNAAAQQDTVIWWITATSVGMFFACVAGFAVVILDVPVWLGILAIGVPVVLVQGLLLFLLLRRKRQPSKLSEQDGKQSP